MSTPTLVSRISSSTSRLRPTLEKKTRPPSSLTSLRGNRLRLGVPARVHAAGHALLRERLLVLLAQERVLHPVRNRGAALGDVHAGVVDRLLAGRAGVAPRVVRAEPRGEAERVLGRGEVLVVPARASGRGAHHADRLVVDALHLVGVPVLPRRDAEALGPAV